MNIEETYRTGSAIWTHILTSAGIRKDQENPRLEFKEPKPSFLQKYDPDCIIKKIRHKRLAKNKQLVIAIGDPYETRNKFDQDFVEQESSTSRIYLIRCKLRCLQNKKSQNKS